MLYFWIIKKYNQKMKKVVSILFLLMFALFLSGQTVDVAKKDTVTVNIVSETKKQVAVNENLQIQLTKAVENQAFAIQVASGAVQEFSCYLSELLREVETRNKNDSQLLTDKFNYPPERVKKVIKIERWLNFLVVVLCLGYLFWSFAGENAIFNRFTAQGLGVKLIFTLSLTFTFYFLLLKLLTTLFNGDYYVIKELITLYT
jgi:hypothetical protein